MARCCSIKTTAFIFGALAVLLYFLLPGADRSIPNLPPYVESLPVIGNSIDNISHNKAWILKILKQYGAVAHAWIMFQNNILAMDAQGSEMVYNEQRFTRHGAIPDFALKLLPWNVGNMDGEEHKQRKTLLLETVTDTMLDKYRPIISQLVDRYFSRWSTQTGNFSFSDETFGFYALMLSRSFLGQDLEIGGEIYENLKFLRGCVMDAVPVDLPGTTYNKCLKTVNAQLKWYADVITDHYNHPEKYDDGFSAVYAHMKKTKQEVSAEDMAKEINHMMFAGPPVAWKLATNTILALMKYPEYLQRVKAEIKENTKQRIEFDINKILPPMELDMALKETIRMYVGLPGILAKARETFNFTHAYPDGTSKTYTFPKGWVGQMSINAVNYNPDNFEEPETFKPHRWHSDAGKHSPEKFNFNTFGAGPVMGHRCLGQRLAPFVTKTFVFELFARGCTFEMVHPDEWLEFNMQMVPIPEKGFLIHNFKCAK
jgi:cytochrome P450